ncbi:MAG: hypothetical protein NTU90_08750, partial [Proteobacteria bacterium]|nr:hypothetical protein [Pseudomonadota bacterium]
MSEIPSIQVVEPSAEQSKHRAAGIFVRKESYLNIESIKEHLKEIREYSKNNYAFLLEELKKTFSQFNEVKLTTAKDVKEAVSYITKVAGKTTL